MRRLEKWIEKKSGWQKTLLLTIQGYFTHNIGRTAAAMVYYLLFALFPFLIFVTSLLGVLHLPMISLEGDFAHFLPDDVISLLNLAILHVTENSSGTILTLGLIFTIWFPLRAISNLVGVVGEIYGCPRSGKKIWLPIIGLSILTIIAIPVVLLLLIFGENVLHFVGQFIPLSETFIAKWASLRFLSMAGALFFLLCAYYFFSPFQRQPARYILPGAALSMCVWILFSWGFTYYTENMGRYSFLYGSIGVIIAFFVWLNCSTTTMLMGAVFNAAKRRTEEEA